MNRNHLKGRDGDRANAVLAAAGDNVRLLLRWLEELLRVLMKCPPARPRYAELAAHPAHRMLIAVPTKGTNTPPAKTVLKIRAKLALSRGLQGELAYHLAPPGCFAKFSLSQWDSLNQTQLSGALRGVLRICNTFQLFCNAR